MNLDLSWTDTCFLSVLLLCVVFTLRGLRKPHIKNAMHHILQKPVAVGASLVLVVFLCIGVLDSIHLSTNNKMKSPSILDNLLAPLGQVYEQSYSAPLALTLYASEVLMHDAQVEQFRPRLKYVSKTIQNERDKRAFIQRVVVKSGFFSMCGVIGLYVLMCCLNALFRKADKPPILSKKSQWTFLMTAFIVLFLMIASYYLSRDLHVFGTGKIGQDIFYSAIKSIRTGLVIGILTTLFMMPLALFAGISAGYFGGVIDDAIQYLYTTLSSIPGVLLITASVLSMQTYIVNHPQQFTTLAQSADARLLALCLILGLTSWTSLCRLLRAEALKLREIDFVLAAEALGSSAFTIIRKHLLPNVMHIVIITLVLDFSFLVLAEAVLSYVGVGVSPLTISWGNMINAARLELAREPVVWWPMFAAFLFMFTLVLASNLFADAVRDAFEDLD